MSDDDGEENVRDRLRRRFDSEDADGDSDADDTETSSMNAQNSQNAMRATNVKKAWSATSVYLPGFLKRRLTTAYKRLDLAYEEAVGESLQKTRYYYPLVIALGVERLEEMDPSEVKERIERLEREAEE